MTEAPLFVSFVVGLPDHSRIFGNTVVKVQLPVTNGLLVTVKKHLHDNAVLAIARKAGFAQLGCSVTILNFIVLADEVVPPT